jgi:hypothetical protein
MLSRSDVVPSVGPAVRQQYRAEFRDSAHFSWRRSQLAQVAIWSTRWLRSHAAITRGWACSDGLEWMVARALHAGGHPSWARAVGTSFTKRSAPVRLTKTGSSGAIQSRTRRSIALARATADALHISTPSRSAPSARA